MAENQTSQVQNPLLREGLMPQEEKLDTAVRRQRLVIGIPCETDKNESRVPLTPEAVEILVGHGHEILVEQNAGRSANYSDTDYSERGAYILTSHEQVLRADIVLKVAPLNKDDIQLLKGKQTILSSLHIQSQQQEYIAGLLQKKVTAIAFENIKDEHDTYPVVNSMSSIAGITAIHIAAELLSTAHGGKGVMLGGIPGISPTEVVILGSGTVAEYATRAAIGLGALVKVFDNSVHRLRRLQTNVGFPVYTSIFHPNVLEKSLRSADVLIGALHIRENKPRFLITEDMVRTMKRGSVIIDVSIDQGGCIETSECRPLSDPVYVKHNVIHYSVPNLPSRVARTASIALSNVFLPLLLEIGETGSIEKTIKFNTGFRNGVYIFNGILTSKTIADLFSLPFQDINLLMAAF